MEINLSLYLVMQVTISGTKINTGVSLCVLKKICTLNEKITVGKYLMI